MDAAFGPVTTFCVYSDTTAWEDEGKNNIILKVDFELDLIHIMAKALENGLSVYPIREMLMDYVPELPISKHELFKFLASAIGPVQNKK
jgi:hypothetical protein